ncbi:MAG: hypothetical protein WB919_22030 [Candidatus Sulfotelmatobacter sp.]
MRISFCCIAIVFALGSAFGQETNFANGPQYLMTSGSPLFARSLSTPSISLSGPPLETGADTATGDLIAGAENRTALPPSAVALPQVDLFPIYYGGAPVSFIEVSMSEAPSQPNLPASILDTGVWQLTTVQALLELGYGETLVEAAGFNKARMKHATRTYTNADVDRLHVN